MSLRHIEWKYWCFQVALLLLSLDDGNCKKHGCCPQQKQVWKFPFNRETLASWYHKGRGSIEGMSLYLPFFFLPQLHWIFFFTFSNHSVISDHWVISEICRLWLPLFVLFVPLLAEDGDQGEQYLSMLWFCNGWPTTHSSQVVVWIEPI